jgi:glycosyltransferase involved in cell wall biosynthesis
MAKISILIPAYNYLDGLIRIIKTLKISDSSLVEILIFDDSSNDNISSYISKSNFSKNIVYKRNKASDGAVNNWNKLIEESTGEYILLMHHDEFPSDDLFLNNLLILVNRFSNVDVFSFKCVLLSNKQSFVRCHVTSFFRKFYAKTSPEYLFKRNFLGPVSTLLIRKSIIPRFDPNLKWFVDVSFYYELMMRTKRWLFYDDIIVFSEIERADSITSNLKQTLKEVKKNEKKYLLNIFHNQNVFAQIIKHFFLDVFLVFDIYIKSIFVTKFDKIDYL